MLSALSLEIGVPDKKDLAANVKARNYIHALNKEYRMKKYICDVCGWIYDQEVGDPDSGIAPGTAFEDIPADWECPECGVGKDDFSVLDD